MIEFNNWQVKSLGEVAEVIAGQSQPSSTYNFRHDGLPFFQGKVDFGIIFPKVRVWCNKPMKIARSNDILISVRAPVGPTNICDVESCIGRGLSAIRVGKNLYYKFIFYFLRFNENKISTQGRGSTFNAITQDELRKIQIPLPPLPIQKQIAEILEKADEAKQKRKEANKQTDEFLQSIFIEMFGDPVKNPKGWVIKKFEELGKLARGKSKHRPRNAPFLLGGPYPLIQTSEIVNSSIYIKQYSQTYSEEGLKQSKLWPKGTLCISIAANIGFTAILGFDACFPDSVVGFVPSKEVIIEYIHFHFMFIQNQLEENAPQAAQKNINLEILGNLKVPVPPLSLQKQFSEIVNKTEALKEKQKQSEQELENLFQSLMQKAFKGELVS